MKRFLSGTGLVLFIVFSLNAQIINLFTPGKPCISIRQNVQFNLVPDTKENGIGFSTIAEFDFKELKSDLGVNIADHQFDLTAHAVYWPTFFDILNFGIGFTYHLNDFPGAYYEQDFLANLYTKIKVGPYFMAWTRWGGFYKISDIHGITPDFNNIEKSMNFNLVLTWYPHPLWSCYFSCESNSYFNYPTFMSVFFNTGAEFEVIKDKFSAGVDVCTKWLDIVVVTQNISQMNLKFYGRYKL